jgi:hypothetical protein
MRNAFPRMPIRWVGEPLVHHDGNLSQDVEALGFACDVWGDRLVEGFLSGFTLRLIGWGEEGGEGEFWIVWGRGEVVGGDEEDGFVLRPTAVGPEMLAQQRIDQASPRCSAFVVVCDLVLEFSLFGAAFVVGEGACGFCADFRGVGLSLVDEIHDVAQEGDGGGWFFAGHGEGFDAGGSDGVGEADAQFVRGILHERVELVDGGFGFGHVCDLPPSWCDWML